MTMTPASALHSRTLALLLKGWLEKHNKSIKFPYLMELIRSLRYLVQRASIMHTPDDLTAMVLINVERYIAAAGLALEEYSMHSILFTSFAITAKYWEDDRLFNSHIAPACGMRLEHLNQMEIHFLTHVKFQVTVTKEQVTEFNNDAKKRWEGRPSVTSSSSPSSFSSLSRLVSNFLNPTKPLLATPSCSSSSSSSSYSSSPKISTRTLSSPAIKVPTPRPAATRTISTPNFSTVATPLLQISRPSPLTSSHTFTKPQRSSSAKEVNKRTEKIEKASTKFLNFFRTRDE